MWAKRRQNALYKLKRGTTENRPSIKARILQRDGGRCVICDLEEHEPDEQRQKTQNQEKGNSKVDRHARRAVL